MNNGHQNQHWIKIVLGVGCAAFALGLAGFIYSGYFSRYTADDYCQAVYVHFYSFWQGEVAAWQIMSGRFMANSMSGFAELFGPLTIRLTSGLAIILFSVGLGLFFTRARRFLLFSVPPASGWLCAMLVVFSTIVVAPTRAQSLYWRDGMNTYFLPMAFFSFTLLLAITPLERGHPGWRVWLSALGCALLTFMTAGLTETFAAFEIIFFLFTMVGFAVLARGWLQRRGLLIVGFSLLGSLVGLGLIALSPTTHDRQAYFPPPPDLITVVQLSMRYASIFMRTTTMLNKLVTVMTTGIPALLLYYLAPRQLPGKTWQWLLAAVLTPLIGYALLVAVCAPSAYGETSYPEPRVLTIARFCVVCTTLMFGGIVGLLARRVPWAWIDPTQKPAATAASLLVLVGLCLCAVPISWQINSSEIPSRQAWAAAWDQRDAQLRAAAARGDTSITVVALDSWETLYELGSDPKHWINTCAAGYYGLKEIIAVPPQ
jgi:hypothetical protein